MEIFLIYASTSGNVETVVEWTAEKLTQTGISTQLFRAEQCTPDIFSQADYFVLATSTWEHGYLNPFFVPLHKSMKDLDFSEKKAAFIGLGDQRYEPVYFCQGMETVRETWLKKGGTELLERLKIQGEPYAQLETVVGPWVNSLSSILTASHD